jgi:hypothetical protein
VREGENGASHGQCALSWQTPLGATRHTVCPSLSLSRTHTHTHTLSLSLSHTHTHSVDTYAVPGESPRTSKMERLMRTSVRDASILSRDQAFQCLFVTKRHTKRSGVCRALHVCVCNAANASSAWQSIMYTLAQNDGESVCVSESV